MSNESIIMFDPDTHYFTVIDLILASWGMELSGVAHNEPKAVEIVKEIEAGKLKPTIAIIEAHMGKSENDGEKIAKKLRELVKDIKIIGFSTYETAEWADEEAIKSLRDQTKTITTSLSKVLKKEYSLSNVTDENRPEDPIEY